MTAILVAIAWYMSLSAETNKSTYISIVLFVTMLKSCSVTIQSAA